MMTTKKLEWLFRPLAPGMRARLEICFGVVVTAAAVVGLSTVIRPDPSRLAPAAQEAAPVTAATSNLERGTEADLRAELPAAPKVAPDFAKAVGRGDFDAMEKLYTEGMPLDGMLAVAADSGRTHVVRWLLEHGADVHDEEESVDAPILVADEHPEIVALLRARGAREPSLAAAAQACATNAVVRLLAGHATPNGSNGDESPLHAAVSSTRGTPDKRDFIIGKLLAAGADPNRGDGDSVLAAAARGCENTTSDERDPWSSDCVPVIKLLLKHGARPTGDALVAALNLDYPDHGAPLQALLAGKLERGATAVALAQASNVDAATVKLLVAKGVDWAWHDGESDAALPVIAAVQRSDRDYLRTLLDAGAPVDMHYKDGSCALTEAIDAAANNPEYARIVELLVARGANVNRRLPDGRTPLFAAAESGDLRVLAALLDKGARVNDLVLDDTALDAAEQASHQAAARVLHARGGRRARQP